MGLFNAILGNASEVSIENVSKEFQPILIDGEIIEKAYKLIKDMFVFTNKRLILVEKQLVGTKVDYMSIPYFNIKKFSKESAGIHHLDAELKNMTVSLSDKIIFSAIKGIVPETSLIVGEHFHVHYKIPYENIGVITGPCHAEEVALERLSYLTIACGDVKKAKTMAKNLSSDYINAKTSDDIIGTEYAAMLKNIYAIAAGIAHGLGYGDNFQSVLMSNGIREMKKFIQKVHKMKRNINNSAYLGDLLVTGYSVFSRNRMFGNMIGKGYTVKSAQMEMSMVAEGYYATKSAYMLNQKYGAKTPIIDAVYSILYEGKEPKKVFKKLTEKLD